jgi:hypothetical protein
MVPTLELSLSNEIFADVAHLAIFPSHFLPANGPRLNGWGHLHETLHSPAAEAMRQANKAPVRK